MFGLFKKRPDTHQPSAATATMRGYKVTNVGRTHKYGVAANSWQMLCDKATLKLNIDNPRIYVANDGTELTDDAYFGTLAAQTLFVVATSGDHVQTDFELMCETIQSSVSLIEQGRIIREFLHENGTQNSIEKWSKRVEQRESDADSLLLASSREEHPDWFVGQPETIDTKEKLMRRRSQDRIRGYFYKTKDFLTKSQLYKSHPEARQLIDTILNVFQLLLQQVDYFKTYFDRECSKRLQSAEDGDTTDGETPAKKMIRHNIHEIFEQNADLARLSVSLCNARGDFRCHGVWSDVVCHYTDHSINPYGSREAAIMFQMWNLDHRVEISRTIIPSLLQSVEEFVGDDAVKCRRHRRTGRTVSIVRYFYEIFTVDNLRLVHIVCHDKGMHALTSTGGALCDRCDEYGLLRKILAAAKLKIGS